MNRFNVLMNDVLAHIGEKPLIFGSGSLEPIQNTMLQKKVLYQFLVCGVGDIRRF